MILNARRCLHPQYVAVAELDGKGGNADTGPCDIHEVELNLPAPAHARYRRDVFKEAYVHPSVIDELQR